jgi:hypothetical protein
MPEWYTRALDQSADNVTVLFDNRDIEVMEAVARPSRLRKVREDGSGGPLWEGSELG